MTSCHRGTSCNKNGEKNLLIKKQKRQYNYFLIFEVEQTSEVRVITIVQFMSNETKTHKNKFYG